MITVGLTGGMGSGKTTVAKKWEEMGAYVVNADSLAKEMMTNDPDLRVAISAVFGKESYNPDGSLDRKYLAVMAFEKGMVEDLNKIVHPAVYRKTSELMSLAESAGYEIFVKEAAILLKNGRPDNLDVIVLVTSPLQDRIKRITKRDSLSEKEVRYRIEFQQKDEELIPYSDYLINNEKDMDHLISESVRIYEILAGYNHVGNQDKIH